MLWNCVCYENKSDFLLNEMGVPKFYRWISERYPCLSEVLKEYQVGFEGCQATRHISNSRHETSWCTDSSDSDTSDPRHFGTIETGPKCPNSSALVPKCPCDSAEMFAVRPLLVCEVRMSKAACYTGAIGLPKTTAVITGRPVVTKPFTAL